MDIELNRYLQSVNFDKQFKNIIRKLAAKKVVIYGCGQLFEVINQNYDLSKLNIIGVCDLKFQDEEENKDFLGYKIIPKTKIQNYSPDYILIAAVNYVDIIKNFNCNIKLKPLVKKKILTVLKEIWGK